MTIETLNTEDLSSTTINIITELALAADTMLPLTSETIAKHPFRVVAYQDETVIGYSAITTLYGGRVAEFGGLIVHPNARRQGIAEQLTRFTLQYCTQALPYIERVVAFGNHKSTPLFQKIGGVILGSRDNLQGNIWMNEAACPPKPLPNHRTTCNTVIELTEVIYETA